jgi:hypothetical protein
MSGGTEQNKSQTMSHRSTERAKKQNDSCENVGERLSVKALEFFSGKHAMKASESAFEERDSGSGCG